MDLKNINWNKETYQQFLEYLFLQEDTKYKIFHGKLLGKEESIIGIRTPILKKIAKEISVGDYRTFIRLNTHNFYEEKVIHGLLLGYIKEDFDNVLPLLNEFLPYNDSWAVNDLTCANMKIFKKNLENGLKYIEELIKSKNPWDIRFALVLLLDFYVNDSYIDIVLDMCNNIISEYYYVQMANSWLVSLCFIKYKNKTYLFLEKTKIDTFTYNKAISKICDSYRVDTEDKGILKKMRRK